MIVRYYCIITVISDVHVNIVYEVKKAPNLTKCAPKY